MTKRLVAGPWTGEFGWEVMSWQGYIRKLAPQYDEVIVSSFVGNEALYADFAHKYIPHNIEGLRDCWYMRPRNPEHLGKLFSHMKSLGGDMVLPNKYIPIERQKFIRYGNSAQMPRYDLLIHARKPVGKWPGRAWPPQKWNELIRRLAAQRFRMAAIGTEAYVPEGVVDFTHLKLAEVLDIMASSVMIVGPSSGPMPLASLCGTPQLVWSDSQRYCAIGCNNRQRFETLWNPFRTPCRVMDAYAWQPPVPIIEVAILECIESWKPKQKLCFSEASSTSGVAVL